MKHVQVRLENGEHEALQERANRDFEGNLQVAAKEAIMRFLAAGGAGNKRLHGLLDSVLGYEGDGFVGPMLERCATAARTTRKRGSGSS